MCAFVGLAFILLVYFLGSLFPSVFPSGKTATDLPSDSLSFDMDHLALYGVIIWISMMLLVHILDKSKKPEDQIDGKHALRPDARKHQILKSAGVISVAAVLIFVVWSWGHSDSPPLSVDYRHSYIGKGYVMVIKNVSNLPMYNIRVKIGSLGSLDNLITDTLAPSASKEVGWIQLTNGKLDAGEVTYVYARGYNDPVISHVY